MGGPAGAINRAAPAPAGATARATLRRTSLALFACLVGTPTAGAADLAPPPVVVPTAPDWNGFYIGGSLGLIDSTAHYNYSTLFSGELNNHTRIGTINGAAPGVFGGYNHRLDAFVLGVEGGATFTNGRFGLNGPNFDALQFSNAVYTFSGRLGYLLTPSTLVYGRLGISRIDLSGFQNFGQHFSKTVTGTQVGAGIEHLITDHLVLRTEAAYTSGSQDLVLNQGFDHYRPSFLWATVGLAYKFDPSPPAAEAVPVLRNRLITREPRWTTVWLGGDAGILGGQTTRFDRTFGLLGPYNETRFAGGVSGGADLQFGRYLVVGAAFDALFTHAVAIDDVGVGLANVYHRFATIDRVAAVTGRLGVLVSPTVLLYGKGGPAQILYTPDRDYFATINPAVAVTRARLPAVQGGLGMESLIADHLAFRVEGLYTRATRGLVIDGVLPGQTTIQPATLSGTAGLILKY